MQVLHAPDIIDLTGKKTIFLAGPIRCARDWQGSLIKYISKMNDKRHEDLVIATPRRVQGHVPKKDFTYMMYEDQIKWETSHLSKAATSGFVTCFLANQLDDDPQQSYARTTRFEIGEWFGLLQTRDDVHIILGFEKQFSGLKYIITRIKMLLADNPEKAKQITVCGEGLDAFIRTIYKKTV